MVAAAVLSKPTAPNQALEDDRVEAIAPFDESSVQEPQLRQFLSYWRGLCRGRRFPARADLDPVDIPRLLPYMMLVDVADANAGSFAFRLIGSHITDMVGFNPTGRSLDAFLGDGSFGDFTHGIHAQSLRLGCPVYGGGRHLTAYETTHTCRRVMCPLSDDGTTISTIVTCAMFTKHTLNPAPIVNSDGRVSVEFLHAVG